MTNTIKKLWRLGALALLCFSSVAFADSLIVTGPGNNFYGGEWNGPYPATLNGQAVSVICDDFAHNTYVGISYAVNITNGVVATPGTTRWSDQATYDKIAFLATKLIDPSTTCSVGVNCRGDIQFAIWSMFSNAALPQLQSNTGSTSGASFWVTAANNWYNGGKIEAIAAFDLATPKDLSAAGPQEFLVVRADEAPAPAILALNLLALLGLVAFFRRRQLHASR